MNTLNRLQLLSHKQIFPSKKDAELYINEKFKPFSLIGEPAVVYYGDESNPKLLLAIGLGNSKIGIIDVDDIRGNVSKSLENIGVNSADIEEIEKRIKEIIDSCGLKFDDNKITGKITYEPPVNDPILKGSKNISDALNKLSTEIKNNKVDIDITCEGSNFEKNELLLKIGDNRKIIKLPGLKSLKEGKYIPSKESIEITANDGSKFNIDLTDILENWVIDDSRNNGPIILHRISSGIKGDPDKVYAILKKTSSPDNLLIVRDNGLMVDKKEIENISLNKTNEIVEPIKNTVSNLNTVKADKTALEIETDRAKEAERQITNSISLKADDSKLVDEINRAKEIELGLKNRVDNKADIVDLQKEVKRATNSEAEIKGILDNKADIVDLQKENKRAEKEELRINNELNRHISDSDIKFKERYTKIESNSLFMTKSEGQELSLNAGNTNSINNEIIDQTLFSHVKIYEDNENIIGINPIDGGIYANVSLKYDNIKKEIIFTNSGCNSNTNKLIIPLCEFDNYFETKCCIGPIRLHKVNKPSDDSHPCGYDELSAELLISNDKNNLIKLDNNQLFASKDAIDHDVLWQEENGEIVTISLQKAIDFLRKNRVTNEDIIKIKALIDLIRTDLGEKSDEPDINGSAFSRISFLNNEIINLKISFDNKLKEEIQKLYFNDEPLINEYVSSVSQENGVINVKRNKLPISGIKPDDNILSLENNNISSSLSLTIDNEKQLDGNRYLYLKGIKDKTISKISIEDISSKTLDCGEF